MGCCSVKGNLLSATVIQIIFTAQRQIIDFLGYMWLPIIANFFHLIFVIVGAFGASQKRVKYLIGYALWNVVSLGWNLLVICVYLRVGVLSPDLGILDFNTGSRSWWEFHGPGCRSNRTELDLHLYGGDNFVEGCLIDHSYVEAIQAGVHSFLILWGLSSALALLYKIQTYEEDSCSSKPTLKTLPYSIEYHPHPSEARPPMTPRKVKQRSTRAKRPHYRNPVTKLMERSLSMSSQDSVRTNALYRGQSNPLYTGSRTSSVVYLNNGRPSPIYMNDSDTVI